MTTSTAANPLVDEDIRPPGRMTDRAFRVLVFAVGALVLVILALILVTLFNQSLPVVRSEGLSYLTSDVWDPSKAAFGTLAFTFGTVVTSALALVIAVPVSVGIALFTTEVSPRWLKRPMSDCGSRSPPPVCGGSIPAAARCNPSARIPTCPRRCRKTESTH